MGCDDGASSTVITTTSNVWFMGLPGFDDINEGRREGPHEHDFTVLNIRTSLKASFLRGLLRRDVGQVACSFRCVDLMLAVREELWTALWLATRSIRAHNSRHYPTFVDLVGVICDLTRTENSRSEPRRIKSLSFT